MSAPVARFYPRRLPWTTGKLWVWNHAVRPYTGESITKTVALPVSPLAVSCARGNPVRLCCDLCGRPVLNTLWYHSSLNETPKHDQQLSR